MGLAVHDIMRRASSSACLLALLARAALATTSYQAVSSSGSSSLYLGGEGSSASRIVRVGDVQITSDSTDGFTLTVTSGSLIIVGWADPHPVPGAQRPRGGRATERRRLTSPPAPCTSSSPTPRDPSRGRCTSASRAPRSRTPAATGGSLEVDRHRQTDQPAPPLVKPPMVSRSRSPPPWPPRSASRRWRRSSFQLVPMSRDLAPSGLRAAQSYEVVVNEGKQAGGGQGLHLDPPARPRRPRSRTRAPTTSSSSYRPSSSWARAAGRDHPGDLAGQPQPPHRAGLPPGGRAGPDRPVHPRGRLGRAHLGPDHPAADSTAARCSSARPGPSPTWRWSRRRRGPAPAASPCWRSPCETRAPPGRC